MEILPARPDQWDGVRAVIEAAFGPGEGPRVGQIWTDVEAEGLDRASLVAVDEGRVVGHVGLSHCWIDARRELVDALVLSPLSVAPDQQRRGIGTSLLHAAHEAAEALGAPVVFLEGDPRYYGPRGFARADTLGFAPPTGRTPAAAFQVAVLPARRPWMTGRVIYREVWWRHDAAGLRDPLLAEVEDALDAS